MYLCDFSGFLSANRKPVRFFQRAKNIDLTIYEKNAGVGGTWYSNRYPVREHVFSTTSLVVLTLSLYLGTLLRYSVSYGMFSTMFVSYSTVSDVDIQVPIHVRA